MKTLYLTFFVCFLTVFKVLSQDSTAILEIINRDFSLCETTQIPKAFIKCLKRKGIVYKFTSDEKDFNPSSLTSKNSPNALIIKQAYCEGVGYIIFKERGWMERYSCFIYKRITRKEFEIYKFSFSEPVNSENILKQKLKMVDFKVLNKYRI